MKLSSRIDGQLTSGIIVEVEAYDQSEPASHTFAGLNARNRSMFLEGGHAYVYLIYGLHYCINLVAGPSGHGSGVLIRALEPLEGVELMRRRRGIKDDRNLTSGPAKLTQALGIDRRFDGVWLLGDTEVWLEAHTKFKPQQIASSPRRGISKAKDLHWRWYVRGSRWVSR